MITTSNSNPILKPEDLIRWKRDRGLIKMAVPPRIIFLTPQLQLLKKEKSLFGNTWITGLNGMHLCLDRQAGIYLTSGWGIGSPAMISVCEELRVLGATSFYLIGIAGRLIDEVQEGQIVLAQSAISAEGTSKYYSKKNEIPIPSPSTLVNQLAQKFQALKVVTTDAPYRETHEVVSQWKMAGAALVDMETSALYSFSQFYGLNACSLLVGGDLLSSGKWNMVISMELLNRQLHHALTYCLSQINK